MDRSILYLNKVISRGIVPHGSMRTGGGRRSLWNGGKVGELQDIQLWPLHGIVSTKGSIITHVHYDDALDNIRDKICIWQHNKESIVGTPGCHLTIT